MRPDNTNPLVHRVPISTDDVAIAAGNTVTHSVGLDTINSLSSDGAVVLSGGTLTDNTTLTVTSTFTLSGGTLANATVSAGTTITGTGSGATLSAVTLAGTLDMQANSASVNVSGGLTLPGGLVRLGNAAGSTFGRFFFIDATPETIDGVVGSPGTVLMGAHGANGLYSQSGAVMTLGANLTITGAAGTVSATGVAFDNKGTIADDMEAVRQTLFQPGNLTQPYHSINIDVNKRICFLD
jgi:hypothetical protein